MKHYFALFAFLLVVLPCFSLDRDWPSIVSDGMSTVCRIDVLEGEQLLGCGSGFVIDQSGKILTCAHVVADVKNNPKYHISVSFPKTPDKKYEAAVESYSSEVDCAVLDIKTPLKTSFSLAKGGDPALMTEIVVLGFPGGKSFKSTPGFVQAIQDMPGSGTMIDLSASVTFGNSGGPVVAKDGTVIGMVAQVIPGANFNLAIPARVVRAFLDSESNRAAVTITSDPSDSLVFSNGNYLGKTPVSVRLYGIDLSVSVERDGYQPLKQVIPASTASASTVNFALQPVSRLVRLVVDTKPAGARVWIDNNDMGKSPVSVDSDPGSRLRVRVASFGHPDAYQVVTVGAEAEQKILIEMK